MGQALQRDAGPGRLGRRAAALTAGLILLAWAALAGAPPPDSLQSVRVGQVTAYATAAHLDLAAALADLADRPASWPGLGVRDAGPLRLIVVADSKAFGAVTHGRVPGWGAGAALPGARVIVLRADLPDVTTTLRHELAHLVLHRAIRTRVPLWFDEGYATVASGGWDLSQRFALHLSVALGGVPELRDLDGALRGTEPTADRAYGLAAAAVLGLARHIPGGDLGPLLTQLAAGQPFDSAVHLVTGRTLPQFEYQWRHDTRKRFGGVTWVAGAGLWLLLTLGVVMAWGLHRRIEAPRRAALDVDWPVPESDQLDH
ncbi:MAG: peptidase MA family metallohydrolase, partial [Gemmatimonadales bacterium]